MYFLKVVFFSFSFSLLTSFYAHSALVDGLYQGKVAVKDQSASVRAQALSEALSQVLVKVSGNKTYLNSARQILQSANQYLAGFGYETEDNQLFYIANFDEQKVNTAIKRAGIPIWGKRRPDTLVWLAYQADAKVFERQLLQDSSDGVLKSALLDTAAKRGINLHLPLLDLADPQMLNVYDVWNEFIQNIAPASEKYGTDFVLSVRLFPNIKNDDGQGQNRGNTLPYVFLTEAQLKQKGLSYQELRWQYFLQQQAMGSQQNDSQEQPWKLEWSHFNPDKINTIRSGVIYGGTEQQALQDLVTLIADMMASEFALELTSGDLTQVEMTVTGIDSLTDYKQVLAFLESVLVVDSAKLIKQNGRVSTIELNLTGSEQDLQNALLLEDSVQVVIDQGGNTSSGLDYVWLGQ